MDINDIIALARAGFNAEEIRALTAPAAPVEQEPAPAPVTPEAAAAPEPRPASVPGMDILIAEVKALKSAMQANALAGSSMPFAAEPKADDILASIIAPKGGNK